jgi:hypothetical protein
MWRKVAIFLLLCPVAVVCSAFQNVPYYGPFSYQNIQQMVGQQSGCSTAGNVWSPASNACVASGNPPVATLTLTNQSANVASTPLYSVPTGKAGWYMVTYQAVITQAATTSSTLPSGLLLWTDLDTAVSANGPLGTTSTLNTVGLNSAQLGTSAIKPFTVKDGTTINVGTLNYASSGATPMLYAVHYSLYYLGSS